MKHVDEPVVDSACSLSLSLVPVHVFRPALVFSDQVSVWTISDWDKNSEYLECFYSYSVRRIQYLLVFVVCC